MNGGCSGKGRGRDRSKIPSTPRSGESWGSGRCGDGTRTETILFSAHEADHLPRRWPWCCRSPCTRERCSLSPPFAYRTRAPRHCFAFHCFPAVAMAPGVEAGARRTAKRVLISVEGLRPSRPERRSLRSSVALPGCQGRGERRRCASLLGRTMVPLRRWRPCQLSQSRRRLSRATLMASGPKMEQVQVRERMGPGPARDMAVASETEPVWAHASPACTVRSRTTR